MALPPPTGVAMRAFYPVLGEMELSAEFEHTAVALTETPGKPGFQARDCIMQDNLKGIDLGLALAHEATHALGEDDEDIEGDLRNRKAPDKHIPSDAAARMSRNLTKF
jgi:hypothetical protein